MPSIPHELSRIDACTIFTQGELTRELAIRHDILRGEIGRLESHDVLSRTVDELVEYYRARHHVNPIVLGTPEIELIEGEVDGRFCEDTRSVDPGRRVPIRGVCVRVHIPCGGETTLLRYRPPMNSGVLVEGKLDDGAIVIEHTYRNPPNDQAVNRWIAASVRGVQAMLDRGSRSISQYNDAVVSIARVTITALRTRALALQHLQASLPYPLYHRPDVPAVITSTGIVRKTITLPPASVDPFRPEPALTEHQFGQIMAVVHAMGHSMERSPKTFVTLDEPALRSVLLAGLNAVFQGAATGETFNAGGKTDILVRHGDRNLFIGECKIWDGQRSLADAIHQIMGYATWRDGHMAVVLFVPNTDFGAVLSQIPAIVSSHPAWRGLTRSVGDTEWHHRFVREDDPGRSFLLAITAFHLPR